MYIEIIGFLGVYIAKYSEKASKIGMKGWAEIC